MAIEPHIPWTDAQRATLCQLLKERGLWDDRHAVCGIHSLGALTKDQATECIRRLKGEDPPRRVRRRGDYCFARGRKQLDKGELRLAGDATNRQRRTIASLLTDLQWPPAQRQHWLWYRHHVKDLDRDPLDRGRASDIIKQLLGALGKQRAGAHEGGAGVPPASATEVPF